VKSRTDAAAKFFPCFCTQTAAARIRQVSSALDRGDTPVRYNIVSAKRPMSGRPNGHGYRSAHRERKTLQRRFDALHCRPTTTNQLKFCALSFCGDTSVARRGFVAVTGSWVASGAYFSRLDMGREGGTRNPRQLCRQHDSRGSQSRASTGIRNGSRRSRSTAPGRS
jgi:hypothetical protein